MWSESFLNKCLGAIQLSVVAMTLLGSLCVVQSVSAEEAGEKGKTIPQLFDSIRESRSRGETGPMLEAIYNVLAKDENNLSALNALAGYHIEKRNFGLARLILERAGEKHKKNSTIFNNIGVIELYVGNERAAMSNFLLATRSKSDYEIGASNLGSIYIKYKDYKRSLKPLEDAYTNTRAGLKEGETLAVNIANNYAVALAELGEPKTANKIYNNILEGESRDPNVMLNQVRLLVDVLKDRKEGYRAISKLKFLTENRKILRELESLEQRADKLK